MAGAIVGAIVGEAGKHAGQIAGFFGGKDAANAELDQLERDYYAAVGRRQDELKDTTGRLKSANLSRAAGSGVEIGSITTSAGIPQAETIAERDIRELERQYITRREQINDAVDAAEENIIFSAALGPSFGPAVGEISEAAFGFGGRPFSSTGQGVSAGAVQGIFDSAQGGSASSAARGGAPSGVDLPATTTGEGGNQFGNVAARGPSPSLLGTRNSYAWYA